MLKIALLVLTMGDDGGVSMALTPAENAEDCAATSDVIAQVLEAAAVPVITIRCGESDLSLTPFQHGWSIEDEVNRYRVALIGDTGFTVQPLTADEACIAVSPDIHCTRSGQSVLKP